MYYKVSQERKLEAGTMEENCLLVHLPTHTHVYLLLFFLKSSIYFILFYSTGMCLGVFMCPMCMYRSLQRPEKWDEYPRTVVTANCELLCRCRELR